MEEWKSDPIGSAMRGQNPTVIIRMKTGYATLGWTQFLQGYCVLLVEPKVDYLTDLTKEQWRDMELIRKAIKILYNPEKIKLERGGSTRYPFLHGHVWPRYQWESEERKSKPPSQYPDEIKNNPEHQFSLERHGPMINQIREKLEQLMKEAYAESLQTL